MSQATKDAVWGTWRASVPGRPVRCPVCERAIGAFGIALRVFIRKHPDGSGADPSEPTGFSHKCQRCGEQLDLRIEPRPAAEWIPEAQARR